MQETQETQVQSLGREDAMEEETAAHSSILTWVTPWTVLYSPGGLQSTGSQESDMTATKSTTCIGERIMK